MLRKSLSRPWTPEDTDILASLIREGRSYEQIARRMNRTTGSVRNRASFAGLVTTGREREWKESGAVPHRQYTPSHKP